MSLEYTSHIPSTYLISCGEVTILSFAQCLKRLLKKLLLTKLFYTTNFCDVLVFHCHLCLYTFCVSTWNVTASCLAFTFLFANCFLRYCPEFLAMIRAGRCGMWENCSCFPWPSWSDWCRISGYLPILFGCCCFDKWQKHHVKHRERPVWLWMSSLSHYKDYFPPWIPCIELHSDGNHGGATSWTYYKEIHQKLHLVVYNVVMLKHINDSNMKNVLGSSILWNIWK